MCKFYALVPADKVKTLKLNLANAVSHSEQRAEKEKNEMDHDGIIAAPSKHHNDVDFLEERE